MNSECLWARENEEEKEVTKEEYCSFSDINHYQEISIQDYTSDNESFLLSLFFPNFLQ